MLRSLHFSRASGSIAFSVALCFGSATQAAPLTGNPQWDWGNSALLGLSTEPGVKASTEDLATSTFFDIYYKEFVIDAPQATAFGLGFVAGDQVIAIGAVGVEPLYFRDSFLKINFGSTGTYGVGGATSFGTHSVLGDFQLQSNTNNGYETQDTGSGQGFESVRRHNGGVATAFLQQGGVGIEDGLPFAFLASFQDDGIAVLPKDHVAYTWFISRDGLNRWIEGTGSNYLNPQFDFVLQSGRTAAYFGVTGQPAAVPVPPSVVLVLSALAALGFVSPRRSLPASNQGQATQTDAITGT